jgi:hypothetical protein
MTTSSMPAVLDLADEGLVELGVAADEDLAREGVDYCLRARRGRGCGR